MFYLEPIGMLVPRPDACIRVEKKSLLVLVFHIMVQILCKSKLSMKLERANQPWYAQLILDRLFPPVLG